ncbi:MAG: ATP-binding protein, partial [Lachnospiraceae bacterium]|nr:ATP-binding protein [Lachnospiraceae bacterium]
PHHTITPTALAGGGVIPRPGEISLASGGVLFLDELPEFSGKVIEILRQPLEDRTVVISRLHGSCVFPANTMLAAACNPCPCGFYPDRARCRCSPWQIKRYLGRISRPILDRIDITVEAAPITFEEFRGKTENESSADIRGRVIRVQKIQQERFGQEAAGSVRFNGEMGAKEIERYCKLGPDEEGYLKQVYQEMNLSARACHKILKVARTIADLDGKEQIEKIHLCEAVSYRSLEEKYWN